MGAETPLVYFDGNSLGRPLQGRPGRGCARFVDEEWGGRLIRGWDERWFELPQTIGDDLGRVVLGAAPGQTAVGDSTTVLLYKLMRGSGQRCVRAAPRSCSTATTSRPTATSPRASRSECGLTLRWIEVDPAAGVTADQLAAVRRAADRAVVLLSHVAYRSAWLADVPTLTRIAHDAGALVLWDLCHSAGSRARRARRLGRRPRGRLHLQVPQRRARLAGVLLRRRRGSSTTLTQPIQGWMGAADPFLMGPAYTPAAGHPADAHRHPADRRDARPPGHAGAGRRRRASTRCGRSRSGSPRTPSALADELLAPLGVEVASPRDPELRGGHVTLRHPRMREVTAALWQRDVIPDYRDPDGLRIGLSPLSTSFAEVERGLETIRDVLAGLSA